MGKEFSLSGKNINTYFHVSWFKDAFKFLEHIMSNPRTISEKRIWKNVKGRGRSLIYDTILSFAEVTEVSVTIYELRAEIWTWDLPNAKQDVWYKSLPWN
jgi:hypothetical protein